MIATFEIVHGRALRDAGVAPIDYVIRTSWAAELLPPWQVLNAGAVIGSIDVHVNHSRWTVSCPVEHCIGGQLALDTDHRFVCVECAAGPYEVVWPDERAAIEEVLLRRPLKPTRNWSPGETVADLEAENAEQGL